MGRNHNPTITSPTTPEGKRGETRKQKGKIRQLTSTSKSGSDNPMRMEREAN